MRILIATAHRGIVGGVETYLQRLLPALVNHGHEIALLYRYPAIEDQTSIDRDTPGISHWCMTNAHTLDLVSRWDPDICYLHSLENPNFDEAILNRYKTIFYAHNYYGTCAVGSKCTGWPHPRPCSKPLSLSCISLNYVNGCGTRNPIRLLRTYFEQKHKKKLLHRTCMILVASRHVAEELILNGVDENRITITPLFPTNVKPLLDHPVPRQQSNEILFCGRFTKLKGGDYLIYATVLASRKLGRSLKLVFVGDGSERKCWESLCRRLNLSFEFTGWCGADQLMVFRERADLLAVPSVWPEPFGLVGIEAGCIGLPSVAFRLGGIPDWLVSGKSGELAPCPPEPSGLADAIVRALQDSEHYQQLRVGAWQIASQFTLARHVEKLNGIFNDTL